MDLAKAASFFDQTVCADAAAPSTTFLGQLDLYDDSKRDGVTVDRRILSVDPVISIPAGRVITVAGDTWVVGACQSDTFRGDVIRSKYILHRAHGAATVQTAAQALSTGGTSTWAAKIWIKDMKELETASKLTSFLNIYLPSPIVAAEGSIVTVLGKLHVVRNSYLSAAGFTVAECDELASGVVSGTYTPRTYTASTDTYAAGTPVTLNVLPLRFQDDFAYPNEATEQFKAGDVRALILASAATPVPSATLAFSGKTWRILSAVAEGSCWNCHLRT